ncbi:ankyrin repeat domain-containing protein [Paenibacillus mendelii]|uniref:Ankyrin repeat domain-containing protein n=1 Tax=Paenibacillus mendelii TaxID=206163 RepID=A0ABV6JFH7_9BACL|nr:ankyrin repeat domain-containing protein [Paenibacillus mendelii]MCQ6557088.1 ankyrin repeat domain-containing protein [Paenibacillus mendelii]
MLDRLNPPAELAKDDYLPETGEYGSNVWRMLVASENGDVELAKSLLGRDASLANCSWGYFSPLQFAIREGHINIVKLLLRYGAVAADKSPISWQDTPLQKAIDRGYAEIGELLKEHLERTLHSNTLGETIAAIIRERNEGEVMQFLDRDPAALHSSDERGNTPLHWAVMTRQLRLIDLLIERGADIESIRGDGCKPVHLAISGDYFYRPHRDLPTDTIRNPWFMVGYLISKGAEYEIGTAAAVGDAEHVLRILTRDPEQANIRDTSGRSPLYYAAKHGHVHVIEALLEYGADPSQPEFGASGGAALHAAASGNHMSCAKLLLAAGADPNAEVEASGNAVYIAMNSGFNDMQQMLYAHGGSVSLTSACALGRIDLAGEILAVNPAAANAGDYGPLAQAASCGYTSIVQLLLNYKVDLTGRWYVSNYMSYAFQSGSEMVKLLLDHGAEPNHTNWLGVSYLHLRAMTGDTELARLLLDYGADINAVEEENGTTPLGWAAKYGQRDMVAFLLKHGADKSPEGIQKWASPLKWAERRGHHAIVDMLS